MPHEEVPKRETAWAIRGLLISLGYRPLDATKWSPWVPHGCQRPGPVAEDDGEMFDLLS